MVIDRKIFGRIYGAFFFTKPILICTDADLIKDVLVKDFHLFTDRQTIIGHVDTFEKNILFFQNGDRWKLSRSILSPTFTPAKIAMMYPLMYECADNLIAAMAKKATLKEAISLEPFYFHFTMDVVASCFFGQKTNSHEETTELVRHIESIFHLNKINTIMITLAPTIARLLNMTLTPTEPVHFFKALVSHVLKERRENKVRRPDFLQIVVDSERGLNNNDVDGTEESAKTTYGTGINNTNYFKNDANKVMDETEIIFQSLFFIIAGQESTTILKYVSYHLAMQPTLQDKLYREIKEASDKGELTASVISKLPYVDAVVCEALRMYPPLIATNRVANENYKLGDTGITLEKGTPIHIPLFSIHRDPGYFEDPDTFKPDRFLPENLHKIKDFSFIPFGSGPRSCLGMRFAIIEAKIMLVKVVLNFEFSKTKDTPKMIEFMPINIFPISKYPVMVAVKHRC